MSLEDHHRDAAERLSPAQRIDIPNDVLILDEEFCRVVLAGATRRTARRLEHEGLPFTFVAGRKYRPLAEGQAWLAARIKRNGRSQRRR